MARRLTFTNTAWEDYLYWQSHDKQILKKINRLIKDCQRSPFDGIGKPEPLKRDLSGAWSRRISDEHRLVYVVTTDELRISNCRYHYQ
jgi:toxin YoeB